MEQHVGNDQLQIPSKLKEIEDELQESQNRLVDSYSIDNEFVLNVVSTLDTEEASRKNAQENDSRKRIALLSQHYAENENKFNRILSDFHAGASDNPTLHRIVTKQREECLNFLKEKDSVISELREQLEKNKKEYLDKSGHLVESARVMANRINKLVDNLHGQCKTELNNIEGYLKNVLDSLRQNTMGTFDIKGARKEDDQMKYKALKDSIWSNLQALQEKKFILLDENNESALQLKNNVRTLSIHLRDTEYIHYKNIDKLRYAVAIMKLQLREGKFMACETKRNNIKLFDRSMKLKGRMKKVEEDGQKQYLREVDRYNKSQEQIKRALAAAKSIHNTQISRFSEIYTKRTEEALSHIDNITHIDRYIWEKMLEVNWQPLKYELPTWKPQARISKKDEILKKLRYFMRKDTERSSSVSSLEEMTESMNDGEIRLTRPLDTEKLLNFFCKEFEFLIGDQMLKLSKSIFPDAESFILSNSIFNLLGIKYKEDLESLIAHLLHVADEDKNGQLILSAKDIPKGFEEYMKSKHGVKSKAPWDWVFEEKFAVDERENPNFWAPYYSILPIGRRSIWNTVHLGLRKIHNALKVQVSMQNKRASMLKQNRELESLLAHQRMQDIESMEF